MDEDLIERMFEHCGFIFTIQFLFFGASEFNMTTVEKVRGFTAFALPPASTFRFVISTMGQKMYIWLEDLQSKKQWGTGFLEENDYVSATNRIPNFSVENYISSEKEGLNSEGSIIWDKIDDKGKFNLAEERDAVRFFVEGWYVVNVIVYLVPQREGEKIDVFINKGHLMLT
ncbi:hypothetical protein PHMEG_00018624, partial [Phytophthora megakarya]